MRVAIIIPARWDSSRFPGKPLAMIAGKSLIEWTWRAAKALPFPVYIATDDRRILDTAKAMGAKAILTSIDCRNGTERVAEAAGELLGVDVVINWQGDAPLAPACAPTLLLRALTHDGGADVATPVVRLGPGQSPPGTVFAGVSLGGHAEHFTRVRPDGIRLGHIGMYAYRSATLANYTRHGPSTEETATGLEQLRWFAMGAKIGVAEIAADLEPECNYPGDVAPIEAILGRRAA